VYALIDWNHGKNHEGGWVVWADLAIRPIFIGERRRWQLVDDLEHFSHPQRIF
jgi:hypothetical protein